MVDRFMKMANFFPTTKHLNTTSLARLMNRQIYLHYGIPKGIINNHNPLFTCKF